MHILTVLRLVPDTGEDFELTADGKGIDREWIGFKLNEFDDHALEEAIILKESAGARVTAIALDGEGVDRMLQTALARGADGAIKITHALEPPFAASTAAGLVAEAARKLSCDLVLTGVQTSEDLYGQLAPAVAASLGWPQVSAVSGVTPAADGILVQQEYSGGHASTFSIALPLVLGVQAASRPPRYVSGTKLREVMSAKIEALSVGEPLDAAVPAVLSVEFPKSSGKAEMIQGDTEEVAERIAAVLRERGVLKG